MARKIIGVTVGTPMNPQKIVEQTEHAKQIEKNTQDINNLTENVNNIKIPTDYAKEEHTHDEYSLKDHKHSEYLETIQLDDAVNNALAQAKASGEFDGEDGIDGDSGVYIGTEEPENASVWINPNGEGYKTETWQFELEDGMIVTKEMVLK